VIRLERILRRVPLVTPIVLLAVSVVAQAQSIGSQPGPVDQAAAETAKRYTIQTHPVNTPGAAKLPRTSTTETNRGRSKTPGRGPLEISLINAGRWSRRRSLTLCM
jgi:hypothetical protein